MAPLSDVPLRVGLIATHSDRPFPCRRQSVSIRANIDSCTCSFVATYTFEADYEKAEVVFPVSELGPVVEPLTITLNGESITGSLRPRAPSKYMYNAALYTTEEAPHVIEFISVPSILQDGVDIGDEFTLLIAWKTKMISKDHSEYACLLPLSIFYDIPGLDPDVISLEAHSVRPMARITCLNPAQLVLPEFSEVTVPAITSGSAKRSSSKTYVAKGIFVNAHEWTLESALRGSTYARGAFGGGRSNSTAKNSSKDPDEPLGHPEKCVIFQIHVGNPRQPRWADPGTVVLLVLLLSIFAVCFWQASQRRHGLETNPLIILRDGFRELLQRANLGML